ncbi:MAG: tetratricopeptide repeat protein [Candidatus Aegiribacteria sp.]|nr:tetratricopeptide repeat protein [Candidatus Aegiribacteria sp.]
MSKWISNRYVIVTAITLLMTLAACSSPAVTGMKVHMQNQEYEDIIHLADSVIARGDSLNAEIWFWRGRAQISMNRWADASESFEKTWELDTEGKLDISDYWFAFFNAAASVMNEEEIDSAVELLQTGAEINPERPDFDLMMGDINLNIYSDHAAALESFQIASQKAMALIPVMELEISEASDPYMADYYSQNLDQIITICIQALYNSGSVLSIMSLNAPEEDIPGLLEQAKAAYIKALEIDPTNVDVLEAIADTYLLEGDYESAIGIYNEAFIQIDLGVSEGWLDPEEADDIKANMMISKGYAYIEMEDFDQAINELNAAQDLIGDDFVVLSTLAHAHFVMENYDEALSMLDSAIMIEGLSNDAMGNAYYTKFACYSRKEMDEEAAEALETALEFQPDNARYWELLASTYSRLGRRNDAINAMQQAQDLGVE